MKGADTIEYRFVLTSGRHAVLKAVFDDEVHAPVSSFLLAEVRNFGDEIQNGIRDVIEGRREAYYFSGNIYSLASDSKFSVIENEISEDEQHVKVGTEELYELIADYRTELSRIRENKKLSAAL